MPYAPKWEQQEMRERTKLSEKAWLIKQEFYLSTYDLF
jgi:hypothetical protein